MRISSLLVKDWRNLPEVELTLDPELNVFWGPNGAGKTNLLEAIGVMATLKSFRESSWNEIPRWNCKIAVAGGRIEGASGAGWFRVQVESGGRKAFQDGVAVQDLHRYFEMLRAVIFTPQDVLILKSSPEERRRFMDRAAFSSWPSHLGKIRQFRRVLAQRSTLLRRALMTGRRPADELHAWNERLITLGVEITMTRHRIVEALKRPLSRIHMGISGGRPVQLRYRSFIGLGDERELTTRFKRLLLSTEEEEWRRGANLVGPQRDDLDVRLWEGLGSPAEPSSQEQENPLASSGKESDPRWRVARTFASQGQLRTLALSLKLAELEVASSPEEAPLLLLDDLSSELDQGRMERLLRFIESIPAQVMVTTTDPSMIARFRRKSMKSFRINDGAISATNSSPSLP